MARKRKASKDAKANSKPAAKRLRSKKSDNNDNVGEVEDESNALDQVISSAAPLQAPSPAAVTKTKGSRKNDTSGDTDSQAQGSREELSQTPTGHRLRSGKKIVYVAIPKRNVTRASAAISPTSETPAESISRPKPRMIARPCPFKSPDPWGGWNKAYNKASALRHEKRVSNFLQRAEDEVATEASTTNSASENPSAADVEATSACPTPDTGSASLLGSHEDDVDDDANSQMSPGSSDHRNAYASTLIRIGYNPGSPTFNDKIGEAQEFNEKLKDDNFNVDDAIRSPNPSPTCGPPEDSPPGSPPIEEPPNPGSEPGDDDDDPEQPDPGSDSSPPSSPSPNFTFQYKFYKGWSVYWGGPIRVGSPTAVDRLSFYRRFGEGPWLSVPSGFVVPRLDNVEEHEKDAIRIEEQLAAAAAEHQISRDLAKKAAMEEAEREKAEFAAEKLKSADRKAASMKPKLAKTPLKDGYQTPSESDGSGSDYSATEKANLKKRPAPSSSSDDSDIDIVSDTSKRSSRPKKQVKLQPVTPASSGGYNGPHSSATPTGRLQSSTPKPGRPHNKQLEYCRAIRSRFDAEIKKAAQMFSAKEATILKQVGLGGASIHQENNLYNLFTSARKREQTDAPRTGNWQQEARDEYHAATDHMTEEQKEDYRQQLFDILGSAVKEEVKTVPPISRMRKAEDHIMHFLTTTSRTHPDLHLFVLKIYAGNDPAARAYNGVLTGSAEGHQTLQDLQINITAVVDFVYDHLRHNAHDKAMTALKNGSLFRLNPEAARDATTPAPTADDNGKKSPFIPLREAQKRKRMALEEKELQVAVPTMQSVEERWRGRALVMSTMMKELEEIKTAEDEKKARGVVARNNVSSCLKIAMNHFRKNSEAFKQFQWAHFLTHATQLKITLRGWPVAVGLGPGCGFNSQTTHTQTWDLLAASLRNGNMELVRWSEEEMQLAPGTESYNDIPLVVNGLDQILGRVKDSKASARSVPPKLESQDPPRQARDDVFNGDNIETSDNDNQHLSLRRPTSRSLSKEPMPQATDRMPYRIVDCDLAQSRQSSRNELDSLIPFGSDDLPEIALENDPQLSYSQHDYQQLVHEQDHDSNWRQGKRTYQVPHRGEMGGRQYRELVVDAPMDDRRSWVNKQPEQKPSRRLLPSATTQIPMMAPPISKARVPSLAPTISKTRVLSLAPPISKARVPSMPSLPNSKACIPSTLPSHASTRAPIPPTTFYGALAGPPSSRIPPLNHPSNHIPPQGQSFKKGKEKARVHSAQSNFTSHISQDQDYDRGSESYRFIRQRRMQDGQAGPSREVYLTQEDEKQMSQGFYDDAYATAEYEEDNEN